VSRNLAVVAVVAAFFIGCSAGLIGGVALARFVGPHSPRAEWREGGRGRMPGRESMLVPRLAQALDLTDAQRVKIEALFERARHDHEAVRDSVRAAIERELTPEQLSRWRKIESRFPRSPRGPALEPPGDRERP
jgi:Spy/CpxP family protein refolding chaperone